MSGTSGQISGTSGQSPELPRKPPELPENLLKFTKIRIDERLEDEIQICVN